MSAMVALATADWARFEIECGIGSIIRGEPQVFGDSRETV